MGDHHVVEAHEAFRALLVADGILQRTSVDGLYLRSATYEQVIRGVEALAHRIGVSAEETYEPLLYLPPLLPRSAFERTDYLRSFPDLVGSVDVFRGEDHDHTELLMLADEGRDWTTKLEPAEVVLGSAACHSLYEGMQGQSVGSQGRRLEAVGFCFRHEPSVDPARQQSFRQHEFVYVGTPEGALEHRDLWAERALNAMLSLGLPVERVVANDPFFGRAGRILTANQRDTELKYEIVCPITSTEHPTAIVSSNLHLDHFGTPFNITTTNGERAHTGCVGFGLERIALALLHVHGTNPTTWPDDVQAQLQQ
ncbi:seryl-tRNA synthetase [Phycicoccus badiiscoriae]|uniref:Seryl-tRNA synthetase n=1 Tax=Pedococcus badiiscoriae TaxID=642776 RepID=A0A852WF36_9MICO|nr:amino acid--[acyl-carrier-protein] ligase [Pedococcus badiiscoriae]NYG07389.1 seryl-tRNA synthetase [Pedococcus badiiscoriae]